MKLPRAKAAFMIGLGLTLLLSIGLYVSVGSTPDLCLTYVCSSNLPPNQAVAVFQLHNGLNERVRLGGAFYQCEGLGGTIPTSRDVKTGYMRDSVGYAGGTSVYPGTEYLYVPLPTSKGPYRLVLHCFPESTFTAEHRKGIGLRIVQATTYLPSSVRTLPFAQRFISRCSGIRVVRSAYQDMLPAQPAAPHEPPPRASVSDAPDDRTLDSLPAPGSSGGR
jgi:hypothetical protein